MTPNEIEKAANNVAEETQLDRIEKKLDRLLDERKLSVSMDGKEVGKLLDSGGFLIRSKGKIEFNQR